MTLLSLNELPDWNALNVPLDTALVTAAILPARNCCNEQ